MIASGAKPPCDNLLRLGYLDSMDILTWNGSDLPEALRHLPPGRYVVESLDDTTVLDDDQDRQLREAVQAAAAGRGLDHDEVEARLWARLRR